MAFAAVISHYVLDGLVHVEGLPVAGPGTPALGLGLWRDLSLELGIEAAMTIAALAIYWRATAGGQVAWRGAMLVYLAMLGAMTIGGQVTAPRQRQGQLVAGWIFAPVVFSFIGGVIDGRVLSHGGQLR